MIVGPLLARFGKGYIPRPGGDKIGRRRLDTHFEGFIKLGATFRYNKEERFYGVEAPNGLQGTYMLLDQASVTGTANIVMAAALAHGNTTLTNAAREPEVVQLCEILNESGVQIDGIGTAVLTIHGTGGELVNIEEFSVIPDRIEAGTYLCAGAISRSEITLTHVNSHHLGSVLAKLEEMGSSFTITDDTITIHPSDIIKPVKIVTQEYPAFPTDMQAQFLALATQANGTSIIEERLFENRFMHVSELQRMGANISLNGNVATINGGTKLSGTDVMATDLRASSALVLAGLVADGITDVHRIYHLDRGYDALERKLEGVGANVKRLKES